jgi:predicted RNA polymerase sigma factor
MLTSPDRFCKVYLLRRLSLAGDAALDGYHLFPTVRVDLLMKMARFPEAREEIERAIDMTQACENRNC